jgi:hypothetical protein
MHLRNMIIVLVLLAIVGGIALYIGHQPVPEKTPKLFTIASGDIEKIDLRYPDREIIIARGGADTWKIVKPIETDAEQVTANEVANAVSGLEITDTVAQNTADLAQFGLAIPAVVVTVTTRDKRTLPGIMVGKDTPVGSSSYIKTTDKPAILLVSSGFPAQVNKTLNDLRTRVLFGVKPDDIHKIVIALADTPAIELDRTGDKWAIVKPGSYAADDSEVKRFVDMLTEARVVNFVGDESTNLDKYGLEKPRLTVSIYGGKDNAQESLMLGGKETGSTEGGIYARRGEGTDRPVCTVAGDAFDQLNKPLLDLRDKTVLGFDATKVERAEITLSRSTLTISRDSGGKWQGLADGKSALAEGPVVESLFDQLHGLKGTKIIEDPMTDANRFGMASPNIAIALYGKDQASIGSVNVSELEVTAETNEGGATASRSRRVGYATSSAGKAVYEIPDDKVHDLETTLGRLHSDVIPTPTPAATLTPAVSSKASPAASSTPAAK